MKRSIAKDKLYKAIGVGERTSRKVSLITKADGTRFRRKNANQYGNAEGGNDYTEKRVNHSDKYAKGSTIKGKIAHYKVNGVTFILFEDAMNYCDKNKISYSKIIKTKTYAKGGKAKEPTIVRGFSDDEPYEYGKGGKTPKIIRGFSDDEAYEYGQGGKTGCWCYSIGGL